MPGCCHSFTCIMITHLHLSGGDKPFASLDLPTAPRVGERIQFAGQDSSFEIVGLTYFVNLPLKSDLSTPAPCSLKIWVRPVRF
jgi:hypothetical protein